MVIACHHNHLFEDRPPPCPPPPSGEGSGRGRDGRDPPRWQQDFARWCIDAGASIYVGHGAPRLNGIEIHRGRPIFYNLGNFIFQTATAPGYYDDEVWHGVIAECRFEGSRFVKARLTPLRLNTEGVGGPGHLPTRGLPSLARAAAAEAILPRLASLSQPFGTVIQHRGETAILRPD